MEYLKLGKSERQAARGYDADAHYAVILQVHMLRQGIYQFLGICSAIYEFQFLVFVLFKMHIPHNLVCDYLIKQWGRL